MTGTHCVLQNIMKVYGLYSLKNIYISSVSHKTASYSDKLIFFKKQKKQVFLKVQYIQLFVKLPVKYSGNV